MFRSLLRDRSGNFAMMLSLLLVPLFVTVGLAIDYSRAQSAKTHLQEVADSAVLALASSRETNEAKLTTLANDYIQANFTSRSKSLEPHIARLDISGNRIDLTLTSSINTYFMQLAQTDTVNVAARAVAVRGSDGVTEVAIVVDNTYSMSETDADGVRKIDAAKQAARNLVDAIMTSGENVKVGLVPFSNYVNVGEANSGASWLDIPEQGPPKCFTYDYRNVCTKHEPEYSCTRLVDGVAIPATCGGCVAWAKEPITPYESCEPVQKWFGCVGSRPNGNDRLDDGNPASRYPGILAVHQNCLTPLQPLTFDRNLVRTAIDNMIIELNGLRPFTHMSSGMIWGLNVLSPSAPFTEGAPYHPRNSSPRKVMVVMTDGENSMLMDSAGKHWNIDANSSNAAADRAKTDADTRAICANIEKKNIEVFTIAFMVNDNDAKALLQQCASSNKHYFDASSATEMLAAFAAIGQSISAVRLTQ